MLFRIYKTFCLLLLAVSGSRAFELECKFFKTFYGVVGILYTCDEAEVILSGSQTSLETVSGTHLSNLTNVDVQAVMVAEQKTMEKLPEGLDHLFPHLASILWTFGNLKSISPKDLKPFPDLMVLILNHNQITSLEADLFEHTRSLVLIEMRDNQIKHIGAGIFSGLEKLVKVDLLRNRCIDRESIYEEELKKLRDDLKLDCKPHSARFEDEHEDSEEESGHCTAEKCSKTEL